MKQFLLGFLLVAISTASNAFPRNDSNFAFGGATTNTQNATAIFAPELAGAVNAVGLELFGLTQQLEFAEAALANIDSSRDVFWLWAGTNNILAGAVTGAADPTVAPKDLKAAMTRLYKRLGARIFVVPNLMLLGNIPQFNQDPATQQGINALTAGQNALLAQAMAEFKAEFPDAQVIELDVQGLFLQLETSGQFNNTTEACFTTGLPNGIPCSDYLYADDIHFSSAAAGEIVDLAMTELAGVNVRRFITLGDSFSDVGSFYNTTLRSIGMGIPAFPSFDGRFSDGPNVIDQLEAAIQPEFLSTAFAQPFRKTIERGANNFEQPLDVIVPAGITVPNENKFGVVVLSFDKAGYCVYFAEGQQDGFHKLVTCSSQLTAGKGVSTSRVLLFAPSARGQVSMDLFHY